MDKAEDILQEFAERLGWSVHDCLDYAMEYIENQAQADAWRDFLAQAADQDSEA